MLHITDTVTYAQGSAEARKIQAWLERISPAPGAVSLRGTVTVINAYEVPRATAMRTGLRSFGPSAELPRTGDAGQRISIEDKHADGTRQSWKYEWRDERWDLAAYEFHLGRTGPGVGPKPQPGRR
ncbi:MAG TPA: hypothetical protein VM687_07730 [Stenotrophomonas sp.]|nr:hypothetical protein [Stenotrophomonas sp.]